MQSAELFAYNASQKRFLIEASAILDPCVGPPFERIHDDGATEEGILMRFGGEVAQFRLSSACAVEGRICSWTLMPTMETVRRMPALEHHILLMLNS